MLKLTNKAFTYVALNSKGVRLCVCGFKCDGIEWNSSICKVNWYCFFFFCKYIKCLIDKLYQKQKFTTKSKSTPCDPILMNFCSAIVRRHWMHLLGKCWALTMWMLPYLHDCGCPAATEAVAEVVQYWSLPQVCVSVQHNWSFPGSTECFCLVLWQDMWRKHLCCTCLEVALLQINIQQSLMQI